MRDSFTEEEERLIVSTAIKLIYSGFFTAFNKININPKLSLNSIIVHYLQDSNQQIDYVLKKLKEIDSQLLKDAIVSPRESYYLLDEIYTEKPNFEREYKDAIFIDGSNNRINAGEIKKNPKGILACNKEIGMSYPSAYQTWVLNVLPPGNYTVKVTAGKNQNDSKNVTRIFAVI